MIEAPHSNYPLTQEVWDQKADGLLATLQKIVRLIIAFFQDLSWNFSYAGSFEEAYDAIQNRFASGDQVIRITERLQKIESAARRHIEFADEITSPSGLLLEAVTSCVDQFRKCLVRMEILAHLKTEGLTLPEEADLRLRYHRLLKLDEFVAQLQHELQKEHSHISFDWVEEFLHLQGMLLDHLPSLTHEQKFHPNLPSLPRYQAILLSAANHILDGTDTEDNRVKTLCGMTDWTARLSTEPDIAREVSEAKSLEEEIQLLELAIKNFTRQILQNS